MKDIATRVKNIIIKHLDVDTALVTDEASFVGDLGGDSLDAVELIMAYEEEFKCEIPDEMAKELHTVKEAINYIRSLNPE